MKVDLCPVLAIPVTGAAAVEFFGRQVHVVRSDPEPPAAFMDICMHLGGPLEFADGQFRCQWHGAVFDATGKSVSGPAPEGACLFRLPTVVESGVLKYVYGDGLDS
jgi:nitrite reductase/ring-hydroxylating ferredoxin subunit